MEQLKIMVEIHLVGNKNLSDKRSVNYKISIAPN
jgi:hypothetical protein